MYSVVEHSPGVFKLKQDGSTYLATRNLAPGRTVYGEKLVTIDSIEYRFWNPSRSKLGAAIVNGLKFNPIVPGSFVLYLGVSSGTTCSHVSDIIGIKGHVFGVDFAQRPIRDFIDNVVKYRSNITPILADARKPQTYRFQVSKVDVIFADVAQPDQAEIVNKNARLFLKHNGFSMLSIKSRSIDVSRSPNEIYSEQIDVLLKAGHKVTELIELYPLEKDHALVVSKVD